MTDVIDYKNGYISGIDSHPQAIPLKFIKSLIELYSNQDDLILDPFMGSGSTGVACKELSRNYIGFEFYLKYVEMARRRITTKTLKKLLG